MRAEMLLHESERTRVVGLFWDGGTAIRKEPVGPDAPRRLVQEVAMLQRLRGVVGVAQLLPAPRYPGAMLLEDVGGTGLAGLATPLV